MWQFVHFVRRGTSHMQYFMVSSDWKTLLHKSYGEATLIRPNGSIFYAWTNLQNRLVVVGED